MLEAIPRHWFSWDFTLVDEGRPLAEIDTSKWLENGSLTIDGKLYPLYREGPFWGAFVLEHNGNVLACAEKPSAMTRRVVIDHDGDRYVLKPSGLFSSGFLLFEGDQEIGLLSPRGILSRRADIVLPDRMPLPVKAFIVWLAVLSWRREANSGA